MTIALNWGQHIVVSGDENKHSKYAGVRGEGQGRLKPFNCILLQIQMTFFMIYEF